MRYQCDGCGRIENTIDDFGGRCNQCGSTDIYPEIEWTEEMIRDDLAMFNDPISQEAERLAQEALDEAPFEVELPTIH